MTNDKNFPAVTERAHRALAVVCVLLSVVFAVCFCLVSAFSALQMQEMQKAQQLNTELTNKYNELNLQNQSLIEELNACKAQIESLTQELEAASGSLEEYKQLLSEKEEELASLNTYLTELESTLSQTSADYTALQAQYKDLQAAYNALLNSAEVNVQEMLQDLVFANCRGVVCWGDSLTNSSYPDLMRSYVQTDVYSALPVVKNGYPGMDSAYIMEQVQTYGAAYQDYIFVIWVGTNGGWDEDPDVLISQINTMLSMQSAKAQNRYLVVGITNRTSETGPEVESALEAAYGNKFLNMREYMSQRAIYDAGISPTADDLVLMNVGRVPYSLLNNDGSMIHFNEKGYEMAAKKIYQTMTDLGYFADAKACVEKYSK